MHSSQILKFARTILKRFDKIIVGGGDSSLYAQDGISINPDPDLKPDIVAKFEDCDQLPSGQFSIIVFETLPYNIFIKSDKSMLIQAWRCLKEGGLISIETGIDAKKYQQHLIFLLREIGFKNIEITEQNGYYIQATK